MDRERGGYERKDSGYKRDSFRDGGGEYGRKDPGHKRDSDGKHREGWGKGRSNRPFYVASFLVLLACSSLPRSLSTFPMVCGLSSSIAYSDRLLYIYLACRKIGSGGIN